MASSLENFITGTQDPSVTATPGEIGQLFVRLGTAGIQVWQKQDSGSSTNWSPLSGGSANFPVSQAGLSGAQSIPDATVTLIQFDTIIVDESGWFDNVNYRYVAGADAWYRFNGYINFASGGGNYRYASYAINGGAQEIINQLPPCAGGFNTVIQFNGQVYLNNGDYIDWSCAHNAGGGGLNIGPTYTTILIQKAS